MKQDLQNIQFPNPEICGRKNMYCRLENNGDAVITRDSISISPGSTVSFNTYFNSFSLGKWSKYTCLDNLTLYLDICGNATIQTLSARQINGTTCIKTLSELSVCCDTRTTVSVPFETHEYCELVYFTVTAALDSPVTTSIYGGCYTTEIDPALVKDVHIAAAICTFRREKYILRNIDELRNNIMENPDSPLYGKLDLFISDNGQTLPESAQSDHVRIFKNKNLGGAGGFTRAMIEIMKVRKKLGITHILMMDDDVLISYETLLKTYAMLTIIKPEHADAFIGGHMLKLNRMHIQSEGADYFRQVTHTPVKFNYNLEKLDSIVRNEIEDPVNYLSWWYCCMPASVVTKKNLPLPIFIKRDDIEYGLRNGTTFVILNGICVWHEEFDYKNSSYLDYYYFRNLCILVALRRKNVKADELWSFISKAVDDKLYSYRYKEAELILIGIQDYLKGIDWLKAQDGEALNKQIMSLGYKKVPIDTLDWDFVYGAFVNAQNKKGPATLSRSHKATLNGLLLSSEKNLVTNIFKPTPNQFYRTYKVLHYEDYSKTGFVTQRDLASYRAIDNLRKTIKKQFFANYTAIGDEYRSRVKEITSLDFWEKYLFTEGEIPSYTSVLPEVVRPKNSDAQKAAIKEVRQRHLQQKLTRLRPLENDIVLVSVHKRKGFACNPKYVVLALKQAYGDRLKIYWVTDYPGSCKEVEALGIPIVKRDSQEHYDLTLKAKVYITNDAFPAWAVHRSDQVWINTWHGAVNYKHIGYKYLVPKSELGEKLYRLENREADYFLAATQSFLNDTSDSFEFSRSSFIETGLPRNDIFFGEHEDVIAKIRKKYKLPEDAKIALFAPTFRKGMKSPTSGLDFELLRKSLAQRFSGEWVILLRNHHFAKKSHGHDANVIDVTSYPDMNELLYAADVLVSDYSSCMYDFSLQRKPCFVFATDIETYVQDDRDFAIPPETWPYPIATSNEELAKTIAEFDEAAYSERLEEHIKTLVQYDDGHASEKVAALVGKACGITPLTQS